MLTLLKFYAEWCAPCKAMTSIIEKLDAEDEMLIVSNIDIDANPQERANYNVRGVPTFILLNDGIEVDRVVGSRSLSEMKDWIREFRDL